MIKPKRLKVRLIESMDQDILANIPLFAKLNATELGELAGLLKDIKIESQQPVFWIGDEGSDFFIVQVGRVAVRYPDQMGHEVTLAVLGAGDFFGEISLLDGGPRTATVRASWTDVTLLCLAREAFFSFIQDYPSPAFPIFNIPSKRYSHHIDTLTSTINLQRCIPR